MGEEDECCQGWKETVTFHSALLNCCFKDKPTNQQTNMYRRYLLKVFFLGKITFVLSILIVKSLLMS